MPSDFTGPRTTGFSRFSRNRRGATTASETPVCCTSRINVAIALSAGFCRGESGSSTTQPLVETTTRAGLARATAWAMLRA
ncbi:hypothetical protein D3C71_1976500 [compost metagenome]